MQDKEKWDIFIKCRQQNITENNGTKTNKQNEFKTMNSKQWINWHTNKQVKSKCKNKFKKTNSVVCLHTVHHTIIVRIFPLSLHLVWLLVTLHQHTYFGCNEINDKENSARTNAQWSFQPLLWLHWYNHTGWLGVKHQVTHLLYCDLDLLTLPWPWLEYNHPNISQNTDL